MNIKPLFIHRILEWITLRRLQVISWNVICIALLLHGTEFFLGFKKRDCKKPLDGFNGTDLYTQGQKVILNHFGYRDREFSVPKPDYVYRIMVIGDSLTWGAGLAIEERFTNVLENMFRRQCPSKSIEVLNFGACGSSTIKEADCLKNYIDIVKPDRVVVGFCINDPQNASQGSSVERDNFMRHYEYLQAVFNRSSTLGGFRQLGPLIDRSILETMEYFHVFPSCCEALNRTYQPESQDWIHFQAALKEIKIISDARKLKPPVFAVLNSPVYMDRPTDFKNPDFIEQLFLQWFRKAESAASAVGFLTINMTDDYIQMFSNKIPTAPYDGHPSGELNQVYAKKLFRLLEGDVCGR